MVLWLGACSATTGADNTATSTNPGGVPQKGAVTRGSGGAPGTTGPDDPGGPGAAAMDGGTNARDGRAPGPQTAADGGAPTGAAPPPVAMGDCTSPSGVTVTRTVEHMGGGHEITLRLGFRDGIPVSLADPRRCLTFRDAGQKPLTVQVMNRVPDRAVTILLVDPGSNAQENKAAREAALSLVRSRPVTERVGIFRWGAESTQVVTVHGDRALIEARAAVGLTALAPTLQPLEAALATAGNELAAVGNVGEDLVRALVVVSGRAPRGITPETLSYAGANLVLWLLPRDSDEVMKAVPVGLRFGWEPLGGAIPAATALSRRIDQYRGAAHYAIGHCGDGTAVGAEIVLAGVTTSVKMGIPASQPETLGASCDATLVAMGKRTPTRRIDLSLTPEQKKLAATAYAMKTDFPLSIKLSPDHKPSPAMAHYRGKGSYNCDRKNYTIDLDGKAPRFLMAGSATQRIFLISNCTDHFAMKGFVAYQMMAAEGLFPVKFDYVEVFLDGKTQGVYTLMEKTDTALKHAYSGLTSVVRRSYSMSRNLEIPEVKETTTTEAATLASYKNLLDSVKTLTGAALEAGLRAHLDLDQYLLWMALMNLLNSEDYIDEIYFYSTTTTGSDGKTGDLFHVAGWDQDGILHGGDCHSPLSETFNDPRGLVFCAEANLDRKIFADPLLYGRYVDILSALIDRTPATRLEKAVATTMAKLNGYYQNPGTLAAMVEFKDHDKIDPNNSAAVKDAMQKFGADMVTQFDAQRKKLQAKISTYRMGK